MVQGIYKLISNVSDKVYIGQSKDIDKRFESHVKSLQNGNHHAYKLQEHCNQSKHISSFALSCEVLEVVNDSKYLNGREMYYIDKYDSHMNGYNSIGTHGSETHTKKKERQNIRYKKFESEKLIFEENLSKYGNNIILTRNNYSPSFMHRVNSMIFYFIRNYKMDTYIMSLEQNKQEVTMKVYGVYTKYYKVYIYNSKYDCVTLDEERQISYYKHKKEYGVTPPDTKMDSTTKSKRLFLWYLRRFYNLSPDVIKHNTLKYVKNKYSIPFKSIVDEIGYNGSKFRDHIIRDREVAALMKELSIKSPNGCIQMEVSD